MDGAKKWSAASLARVVEQETADLRERRGYVVKLAEFQLAILVTAPPLAASF